MKSTPFNILLVFLLGFLPGCTKHEAIGTDPAMPPEVSIFVSTEVSVTQPGQDTRVRNSKWEIYFDRDTAALMLVSQRTKSSWLQTYLSGTTWASWTVTDGDVDDLIVKEFSTEADAQNQLYRLTQDIFLAIEPLLGTKTLLENFTLIEEKTRSTLFEVKPEPTAPVFKSITGQGFTIRAESQLDENGDVNSYTFTQANETTETTISGSVTSRETSVPDNLMRVPNKVSEKIEAARAAR